MNEWMMRHSQIREDQFSNVLIMIQHDEAP